MNINIIDYLNHEINENKISHAFLIETDNCDKVLMDIYNVLLNSHLVEDRDIDNNISVKVVKPENNLIDKNKILELQKFLKTKSIIYKYKVYFIMSSELMNASSFNKLLKILEEPTENILGFLITTNMAQIIPTIKSRCIRFKYNYNDTNNQENTEFLEKLSQIKEMSYDEILNIKNALLIKEKNQIINVLKEYQKYIINNNYNNTSLLAKSYKILDNTIEYINLNVNLELCLDKMFIEMRK